MLRFPRAAFLIGALIFVQSVTAIEYHDYFVGFSTELSVSSDPAVRPIIPDSLTVESLAFAGTYGPAAMSPIRFRGGLGWFPYRPFRLFAGVEIPVVEQLNRSRARGFGVYLLADLGVTLPLGWTADASVAVLLPTHPLGGVRIGLGVNRDLDLLFTVSMATGAYPMRSRG
jgi:hypothetical protein